MVEKLKLQFLKLLEYKEYLFVQVISRITCLIAGLMYSNDRPYLTPVKNLISGIAEVNSRLGGKVPFLGAAGVLPLDVEVVARAVVNATLDESVKGVVNVDMLARLGTSNP